MAYLNSRSSKNQVCLTQSNLCIPGMLLPSYTPGPAEVKCSGTAQSRSCSTSTSSVPEVTHRPDASRLQHIHFYIRGQSGISKHNANNPSLILPLSQKIEKPKFQFQMHCLVIYLYFFLHDLEQKSPTVLPVSLHK